MRGAKRFKILSEKRAGTSGFARRLKPSAGKGQTGVSRGGGGGRSISALKRARESGDVAGFVDIIGRPGGREHEDNRGCNGEKRSSLQNGFHSPPRKRRIIAISEPGCFTERSPERYPQVTGISRADLGVTCRYGGPGLKPKPKGRTGNGANPTASLRAACTSGRYRPSRYEISS
jgi:hypothetical protein